MQKRTLVLLALTGFVVSGMMASDPGQDPLPPYKNVKVLSRNIDEDDMESVMHTFNSQLGVTCIYCHTTDTASLPWRANFVSDELPAKRKAREMMRMTFRLNKRYFSTKLNGKMTVKPVIWCKTCHHGLPVPVPIVDEHH